MIDINGAKIGVSLFRADIGPARRRVLGAFNAARGSVGHGIRVFLPLARSAFEQRPGVSTAQWARAAGVVLHAPLIDLRFGSRPNQRRLLFLLAL